MILVVQRVAEAHVLVDGRPTVSIGRGVCVLACALSGDEQGPLDWLAGKLAELRIFDGPQGRPDLSLRDVGGEALIVPQFTLAADWRKGRRPSYLGAAGPPEARRLVAAFARALSGRGVPVREGSFGAHMRVELCNDGPFTLVLDSQAAPRRST